MQVVFMKKNNLVFTFVLHLVQLIMNFFVTIYDTQRHISFVSMFKEIFSAFMYNKQKKSVSLITIECKTILRLRKTLLITNYRFQTATVVVVEVVPAPAKAPSPLPRYHPHSPLPRRHWVGGGSGGDLSCRIPSKHGHVCRNAAVSSGRRHRSKGDIQEGCSGH